ncbi:alpha/beta hydrolase family protein [Roseateles amylovorans]|uniref:Alpha/beta hydrolase n=1 Tax=Roseateles amylovorans TaxID=2978473 RepID=A0ABY6BB02_9BURK|nr:alpha/beta hydrolase [Roseateles amylovorans]UXH80765.1 alpha/beta hydrolase [Roseateles amylovorans]
MKQSVLLGRILRIAATAAAIGTAGLASAQVGPAPSSSSLNATAGPFAVSTSNVILARGFGGGTIYYPSTSGLYGVVAISPGFTATESSVAWLGRRMATHGLVVITINTNTTLDQPASRATQLMAALNYVVNSASSTVRSRVDSTKLAVAGHSMGGGGALIAAEDNPTLKASLPLTPWNLSTSFTRVRVPTLIVGADGDSVASVTVHARPFYASLPASTFKAYAELNLASHFTPNSTNTPIGRYGVAWMKRFVDADTRYSPFLCGAEHNAYNTALVFDRYNQNCPY